MESYAYLELCDVEAVLPVSWDSRTISEPLLGEYCGSPERSLSKEFRVP